ncbi:hypothetical protein GCM10023094_37600 [Rhodococcus olei]|uniref:Non-specific serine/threonine protein kinase n=1 Tax=Rhodococcus olei TaxID=2161675 RepID=A0ABP8PD14_9NOCA
MVDDDRFETQRDVGSAVIAELSAAGFKDADEIGRGGFGVVYHCTQPGLDRTVAVKVLLSSFDDENRARFLREQRAMGRLTGHPNIVGVLQVGETVSGRPFLVMQYHQQGSLDARIRRHGPLPVEEVLRLGVKIAGAVESAHRLGIVHRDVKPANILLTDFDEPVLADFGIAHIAGGFETATGVVTGSPAFTAPEVLEGGAPSRASDVYGIGATLFCALTGHAAFERRAGEQVVAQFLRITTQPVPDLRESGISDDVCAVVESAMSRDPRNRPTAADLGEELQRVQLGHGFGVDEMSVRSQRGAGRRAHGADAPGGGREAGGSSGEVGNLPLELTSFVGRRTELSEVRNALAESRLVTLAGIGGVGKTRLALRAASKVRRDFAGGAWLVQLGELSDASLVVDVVASTLRLRNQGGRPMLEVLVDFLSTRRLLLVLDNCEQVVEAVAELAESLLRACPEVRILATSREVLGIDGESVLPVAPLEFPDPTSAPSLRELTRYDALTLFAERGVAAVPGFELTEDNLLTVARICSRLDGLPLAIELAAARLRVMSSDQILRRLDDRFALLTGGRRGAPSRHQTLRWCVGWSYDLCTQAEQQLWGRLSVFAETFDLDAAERVCGSDLDPQELLDLLSALVDKSILIRGETDGAVRFKLLGAVLDYGRERIEEAGEYQGMSRRHRDWYEQLAIDAADGWVSPRQLEWIGRLDRELPNLRRALEFSLSESGEHALRIASALYSFWIARGMFNEGRRWLDRALARPAGGPSEERAGALYADSIMSAIQGDLPVATARMGELRLLAEGGADAMTSALYAFVDGFVALTSGELARAGTRLEDAVDGFGACGEVTLQLGALISLGWAHELRGDSAGALACHEKALGLAGSHGESVYRAYVLWALGVTVWRRGERDRAERVLEECLRLTQQVGDPLMGTTCLEALAWTASEGNDARRAAVLMGAADAQGRVVGSSTVLFPNLLVYHDECVRRTRATLGVKAFETASREGGSMRIDEAIAFALGEQPRPAGRGTGRSAMLTKRERQVADLLAEGLTNKAIAARLAISQRTVGGHVEHALAKLGFTSRAQIAAWVVERSREERS